MNGHGLYLKFREMFPELAKNSVSWTYTLEDTCTPDAYRKIKNKGIKVTSPRTVFFFTYHGPNDWTLIARTKTF